mmetsp:Transcript_284/g.449  ORF Transcript_284/g.449 Transcript_284/m.449 type:complete len:177 (+) Transcript_284:653-1183(+)
MARSKNPQNCVWWGIVAASAAYGHGSSPYNQNKLGMVLGTLCSIQTLLLRTKIFVDKMDKSITSLLKSEKRIVAALDNNQKGNPLTFQQFGSGNKFVKVMGRFIRQALYFKEDTSSILPTPITFVEQSIVSPHNMLPFEQFDNVNTNILINPTSSKFSSPYTMERECDHILTIFIM